MKKRNYVIILLMLSLALLVTACVDERPPIILVQGTGSVGSSSLVTSSNDQFLEHFDDCGGASCNINMHSDT